MLKISVFFQRSIDHKNISSWGTDLGIVIKHECTVRSLTESNINKVNTHSFPLKGYNSSFTNVKNQATSEHQFCTNSK